jgi:hypothetical protein
VVITINYMGELIELDLSFAQYRNGQTAIQAYSDDGPFAMFTVALVAGHLIPEGYIAINHDCEAMIPELVRVGLIAEPEYVIPQGFVDFKIARLLVEPEGL